MTAPNQTAIPDLTSALGLGAYQIGNTSHYGQNVTEDFVRGLFTLPVLTFENSIAVLTEQLKKLPLDVLKLFAPLIPDPVEEAFSDVLTAVESIANLFVTRKPLVSLEDFQAWITDTFDVLQTLVQQLLDIFNGAVVTPINNEIQAVKEWFESTVAKIVNLTEQGLLDASHLIGEIADHLIPGMSDLRDTAASASAQAEVNAEAIAALQSQISQIATPAYTGDQNDMASVPRASLWQVQIDTTNGGHTHLYEDRNDGGGGTTGKTNASYDTTTFSVPSFRPTSKSAYFVPIWADRKGTLRYFRFIVGGASGLFGLASHVVGLYSFTPTSSSDGTMTRLWQSGNIGNATKQALLQEFTVDMGLGASALVAPGNLLFAAAYQDASGFTQGTRSIAAVPQGGIARSSQVLLPDGNTTASDVLLRAPMYALNNVSGLPTTTTLSGLDQIQTWLPWFAVSVIS